MRKKRHRAPHGEAEAENATLVQVPPQHEARVTGFDTLSTKQRTQLQAYGLAPGHWVHVLQHSPTTIVTVENTELAMEPEIAKGIQVQGIRPARHVQRHAHWGKGWRRHRRHGARRLQRRPLPQDSD
jgi:Fe2+ transport system protein FeoA